MILYEYYIRRYYVDDWNYSDIFPRILFWKETNAKCRDNIFDNSILIYREYSSAWRIYVRCDDI